VITLPHERAQVVRLALQDTPQNRLDRCLLFTASV
jgi:hypothetical protein